MLVYNMPQYEFANPLDDNDRVDVFFHMNDEKRHIVDGVEWRRVYHSPLASIDTKLDPRDKNAFVRRTEKYTRVGDFQSLSRDLSDQRASKDGRDGVKEKWLDNYEKTRNGKKHSERIPKVVETPHVKIDMSS